MIPGWEGRDAGGWAEVLGVPRLELLEEVDSTNTRLRALATGGTPPFTTVVAHAQRAGRGREGRSWRSEGGAGLWISVLLPMPPGGPPGVATLAVGVAVAEAVERLGGEGGGGGGGGGRPGGQVGLKWPNDVMVVAPGGTGVGKLAGILCEVAGGGEGGGAGGIVAGVGVNLRAALHPLPSGVGPGPAGGVREFPAADLETLLGEPVLPSELARHLVRALRHLVDPPPARLEGRLRAAWEARDLLPGTLVEVTPGPRGVVRGVGDDGALLVEAQEEASLQPAGTGQAAGGRGDVVPVRAGRVRWI
ncbi:MAG: biotin--[acetyl-CoA-carboxylase] ligase [Gemmatimonadales bacterium]|nr:MAG: biotin--[acetyl-CoA-carboxylase] ligase [Gemmatimonadales bacterium]